ncbi:MAG: hypothetical protein AAGG75_15270 [Bacteroidota bacterium]
MLNRAMKNEDVEDQEIIRLLRGTQSEIRRAMHILCEVRQEPRKYLIREMKSHYRLSMEDIKDLSQESLMVFYNKVRNADSFQIKDHKGSLNGYLRKICTYKIYQLIRERDQQLIFEKEMKQQLSAMGESPYDLEPPNEKAKFLEELMRRLGSKLGQCLEVLLRYFSGEHQKEMSAYFGLSYGSMRNRINKCKERLDRLMKDDPDIRQIIKSRLL